MKDTNAQQKIVESMTQAYADTKFKLHGERTIIDAIWELTEKLDEQVEEHVKNILYTMHSDDTFDEVEKRLKAEGLEVNEENMKGIIASVTLSVILSIGASLQVEATKVVMDNVSAAMLSFGKDFDKIRSGIDQAFDEALERGKAAGMQRVDSTIELLG